jgi:ubiquinone/menaquinone biosynthesis C-methylase UbiE
MARVRDTFDADAAGYRRYKYSREVSPLDWHSFESRRLCVAEMLPRHAGCALDLGCGSGTYLPLLATRADTVVAVDFSPAMLAEARDACAYLAVTYIEGDATSVPLPAASFDLVICIGVLEYLPDALDGLREIARLLRPGGSAVVSVPNARSAWRLSERVHGPVMRRLRRLIGLRRDEQKMDSFPRRLFTVNELQPLVDAAGLAIARVGFYNHRLPLIGALSPSLSLQVSRRLERVAPAWLAKWLGGGIVVVVTRPAVTEGHGRPSGATVVHA